MSEKNGRALDDEYDEWMVYRIDEDSQETPITFGDLLGALEVLDGHPTTARETLVALVQLLGALKQVLRDRAVVVLEEEDRQP